MTRTKKSKESTKVSDEKVKKDEKNEKNKKTVADINKEEKKEKKEEKKEEKEEKKNSKKENKRESKKQKEIQSESDSEMKDEDIEEDIDKEEGNSEKKSKKKKTIPTFKFESLEEAEGILDEKLKILDKLRSECNSQITETKHYIQDLFRAFKALKKKDDQKREKAENRKSSERIVPKFEASEALIEFMNLPKGSKVSRSEALAFTCKYIEDNKLKGMTVKDEKGKEKIDRRLINLDDKLEKLFPNLIENNETLQYNNLMKCLGQHFPEKGKKTLTTSEKNE